MAVKRYYCNCGDRTHYLKVEVEKDFLIITAGHDDYALTEKDRERLIAQLTRGKNGGVR